LALVPSRLNSEPMGRIATSDELDALLLREPQRLRELLGVSIGVDLRRGEDGTLWVARSSLDGHALPQSLLLQNKRGVLLRILIRSLED